MLARGPGRVLWTCTSACEVNVCLQLNRNPAWPPCPAAMLLHPCQPCLTVCCSLAACAACLQANCCKHAPPWLTSGNRASLIPCMHGHHAPVLPAWTHLNPCALLLNHRASWRYITGRRTLNLNEIWATWGPGNPGWVRIALDGTYSDAISVQIW